MRVDQGGGEFAGLVDAQGGVEEGFLGGGEGGAAFGALGVVLAVGGGRRLWGGGADAAVALWRRGKWVGWWVKAGRRKSRIGRCGCRTDIIVLGVRVVRCIL